jgi:D-glycero-D-manno-heptose 1,7-bisphosphate phosphatase
MRDWPKKPSSKYGRAVFIDRDGTINVDTHYPYQVESLEFIPSAIDGLKILSMLHFHLIVVANQAGIALGIFNREQMSKFNEEIRIRVERAGARIDGFYYCPHLEAKHLQSRVPLCECSKPSPGMLIEAVKDFKLDLSKSFIIGDKTSDIAAGESVGCVTILVKTGEAGKEEGALPVVPRYVTENLYEAALIVRSQSEA